MKMKMIEYFVLKLRIVWIFGYIYGRVLDFNIIIVSGSCGV